MLRALIEPRFVQIMCSATSILDSSVFFTLLRVRLLDQMRNGNGFKAFH
jgi:hypothetical protein